jgi:uncharacterized protein
MKNNLNTIINSDVFTRGLVLPATSIHGPSHSGRVARYGRLIAEQNGADLEVVQLFAFLHDARRENDHTDEFHGVRAAVLFRELVEAKLITLSSLQSSQLELALRMHNSREAASEDLTVQTCWDADRLDLWRVGTIPNPRYMFTDVGKSQEMIDFAKRSVQNL